MTKTTSNKKILIAFIDKKHEYFPYLVKHCHIYSNEGQNLRDTYIKLFFVYSV